MRIKTLMVLGLLLSTPAFVACGPGGGQAASPSTAADEVILGADDEEERQGLKQARDDIDAEMIKEAAQKDAEIEKLRKENEALRARLAK